METRAAPPPAPADNLPSFATLLGRAGLIPFCAAPLVLLAWPGHETIWLQLLADYALAIVSFLVGIWWGLALIRRSGSALILGNAVVIVAFLGRSLLPLPVFLLLAAALLVFTLRLERRHPLFRPQPAYYARLRLQLTAVAGTCLVAAALLAS
jgi:hypothetical protein